MGWTIVQPSPSHIEARKVVSSGYDVSNFAFSQVNTADEQPLQNEELLSLPALYALLKEVDRDEDNCFLMRGKPCKDSLPSTMIVIVPSIVGTCQLVAAELMPAGKMD